MIQIVLTLDYEVFGSGAGDFDPLVVRPTAKLLQLADRFRVPITIMAEVAEILALHRDPRFHQTAGRIDSQLEGALARGHDVQLHLHPAWFRAEFDGELWRLCFEEYSLPGLPHEVVSDYVGQGKRYLEERGRRSGADYRCVAFRAGGWLVQPSTHVAGALVEHGFVLDTSVFKFGFCGSGPQSFDYRSSPHHLRGWRADRTDFSRSDPAGEIYELPIYARGVPAWSLVTARRLRLQRHLRSGSRSGAVVPTIALGKRRIRDRLRPIQPKKFDFCRMNLRELVDYTERAIADSTGGAEVLPVVAIGHSSELNDLSVLEKYFEWVAEQGANVRYSTLRECASRVG